MREGGVRVRDGGRAVGVRVAGVRVVGIRVASPEINHATLKA